MKYFIISDIHSHYNVMHKALQEKGFEQNNNKHMLIVNGDIFDRGPQSQEVKNFLDETNNKIIIFGNHEWLILRAINRGHFRKSDLTNGTVDAAIQLAGGYTKFPRIIDGVPYVKDKAKKLFKVVNYVELSRLDAQKKIIRELVKTGIVEWIVENCYINGTVKWNDGKTNFKISGKPRYYLIVKDRLLMHGFFPSPDFIKVTSSPSSGKIRRFELPDDYDILEESSKSMWEEDMGVGIWSRTDLWLKEYYKCNLTRLYEYLIRKGINHIYLGHWDRRDIIGTPYTISMTDNYMKYSKKLPKIYLTDSATVHTNEIVVETFEV